MPLVSSEPPEIGEPPQIPPSQPETRPELNSFLKRSAQWLNRALAVASVLAKDPRAQAFIKALQAATWLAKDLPYVWSYLDAPKSLEELQKAVENPGPGYQIHHIVEAQYDSKNPQRNSVIFSNRIEARDNLVRIPYWKHVEISAWYSTPNEYYEWKTPREYLRGKSWEDQYHIGVKTMRDFGVLK